MNRLVHVFCFLSLFLINPNIWAYDASGVVSNYALNPSVERTSALISSGQVKMTIGDLDLGSTQGPSYNTKYEYEFFIRYMGTKQGLGEQKIAKELFSQEFIEKLRELGELETLQFNAKYLGSSACPAPNGEQLDECNEILLSNFKNNAQSGISRMMNHILMRSISYSEFYQPSLLLQIENLEIKLTNHPSLDGLGAAKIDANGFYNGIAVKMGLDLVER